MSKPITSFVGLDVHQDSTAIGVAEAGREAPRFLGTVGPDLTQLLKSLKSLGKPNSLLVVTAPLSQIKSAYPYGRVNPNHVTQSLVAVVAGSAVVMSAWASNVPAIAQSWYAGMEGGRRTSHR